MLRIKDDRRILLFVLTLIGEMLAQDPVQVLRQPSAGTAIQAATKATIQDRPRDAIEILSDTQGIDFGPYLKDVVENVRENWYRLIPETAQYKSGKLAIEFNILKSGQIGSMKLVASAGSELDRPAWGSITASNPFRTLPDGFHGEYVALRFRFYYNPYTFDIDPSTSRGPIQRAVLVQSAADSHPIKYPKKALHEKTDGIVRLVADVAPDGSVKNVAAIEGSLVLGDAASQAIRKWRFQPAQYQGKRVKDRVRIRVEFLLDGPQVHSEAFPDESPRDATASP